MQILIPAELFRVSGRLSPQTSDSAGIFLAFSAEIRAFFAHCMVYSGQISLITHFADRINRLKIDFLLCPGSACIPTSSADLPSNRRFPALSDLWS